MCDVLHTMFEEDYTPHFAEEMEVKGRLRTSLYDTLYNEEYQWRIDQGANTNSASGPMDFSDEPSLVAKPRQLRSRVPSGGLAASAVNPETGTMDLPEGTKRADPAKRLPRVQSATPMEDLGSVLDPPLG